MQYPLSSTPPPLLLLKKLLQHKAVQLLPLIFLISENAQGNAQENYQACLYEVENSCKDSNGLGAKYQHITWDRPESACMDAEEIQRCGLPPVIVESTPIDEHAPPPINPPAGDVIGLNPGFYDITPEQERRTKLAQCKVNAINVRDGCYRSETSYRQGERGKCEEANSVTHLFVRIGNTFIKRLPGRAKGLLPAYEELAPYVGRDCAKDYADNLASDKEKCDSNKEKSQVLCEALYGN